VPVSGSDPDSDPRELDARSAAAEQRDSDADQTLSESDRSGSERDQISSDRDQAASDLDQAASDGTRVQGGDSPAYRETRRMRADSTLARHTASKARGTSSGARDLIAEQRDRLASARDLRSAERDERAAALDAEIETLERDRRSDEGDGPTARRVRVRAARERRLASEARAYAALQREAAAEDRAHAAHDRALAAVDRRAYAQELVLAATDEVTGALRRGVGLAALQREMDRTRRSGEQMIFVFVDVDGLKEVNDDDGHAAGDALLRAVARCISDEFRSYDLIVRFGGDEFVCSFSGDAIEEIGRRFQRVGLRLDEAIADATISVGVSQRRPEDTLETLIDRADARMIASRRTWRQPNARHLSRRERAYAR
jgi:diguanylate cyclase (GGDEF)-like protein